MRLQSVARRHLGKTSLVLALALVVGGIISAATVSVDGAGFVRIVIYLCSTIGSGGLFYDHLKTVRASDDEKAYLGAVVLTYVFGALTVLFIALDVLVTLRIAGLINLLDSGVETRLLYGLIGSSSVALLVASMVFNVGRREGLLFLRVDAWPLTALRRMVKDENVTGTDKNRDAMAVKLLATIPGGVGGAVLMSTLFGEDLVWQLYAVWLVFALLLSGFFYFSKRR